VTGFGVKDQSKTVSDDSGYDQKKLALNRRIAQEVCKIASPKAVVLAPKRVSRELLSLPNCPTPLFVDAESQNIPDTDKEKRSALARHVEYKEDISFDETRTFVEDLRRYGVKAIVMSQEGIRNQRVKRILRQMGYDKVQMIEKAHIWIQKLSWREVDERDRRQAEEVCRHVPKASYVLASFGVSVHLEKVGCCRSFLYDLPDAFANPGFERRRGLLESILSVGKDFLAVEAAILKEVLESQLISAIVLIQNGDGNKKLKDELRRYNFKMATKSEYYRLWIPQAHPAN
jgi:hypothetical protein